MTYEQTALRCRNCKFWWPMDEGQPTEHLRDHAKRGQCRRHAPPAVSAELEWAIVKSSDWCGEHVHVSV
jgi:hypothetical protein